MRRSTEKMVRLVGLEPTTGKTPVDFKPTAYANFATAAPLVYAAAKEYHGKLQKGMTLYCRTGAIGRYKVFVGKNVGCSFTRIKRGFGVGTILDTIKKYSVSSISASY